MDYFILFLQQYYWFKKDNFNSFFNKEGDIFPQLIDHMYSECLLALRPKLNLFKSFNEAHSAVEKLKGYLYPNIKNNNIFNCDFVETESEYDNISNESTSKHNKNFSVEEVTKLSLQETYDYNNPNVLSCRIDNRTEDDFLQMFEKLAHECHQDRLKEVKTPSKDISLPITTKIVKKTYDQLQVNTMLKKTNCVEFKLMLRGNKAGKQHLKTFEAPIESDLAKHFILQKEIRKEEDERVKRLTLNITERIEEEDYQESLLQHQRSTSLHKQKHSRQQKFKHQKGVPDTDKIFN